MRYMIDTYGNVDLGTIDWNISGKNFYAYEVSNNIKKPKDDNTTANIYCNLYRAVPLNASFVEGDMALDTSGRLYLRDTRYTTTAEFKEAMRGQILRYELETPANGGYLPIYKGRYKVSDVCQLLDKSKYYPSGTHEGVLYTVNDDGSVTLNGTAIEYTNYSLQKDISVIKGHKYLAGFSSTARDPYLLLYTVDTGVFDIAYPGDAGSVVTCLKDNNEVYYQIKVRAGGTVNNITVYPQFIDLTEMYGVGNEPTTVEEFKQKFPNDLYPYSPYCWAKLKSLIYKDDIEYIKMK